MFGKSRTESAKQNAASAAELAAALAQDKKFRKQLLAATGHGMRAKKHVASRIGTIAVLSRIAADEELRDEVRQMMRNLQAVWQRVEKKRSHRVRNTLLVFVGAGGAAAAATLPQVRKGAQRLAGGVTGGATPRTVQADVEVEVPVSTAYNQWTQFEEFPSFMEGVDEVRQLDDTRLHWVANVGGTRAEWDAKILEQHPDKQISWISEDGKKTRGTVTFEPIGDSRTRVQLSMSYQAEGIREAIGSAAGLDTRRVRGDLERFKDLIEGRDSESGAWRGEISAGKTG
jgi:uncharacterized membrane protein